jgi:hypothetical protein
MCSRQAKQPGKSNGKQFSWYQCNFTQMTATAANLAVESNGNTKVT